MAYLIDGSNLGGAVAGAEGARDRRRVLRRLLPWARARRSVVLVFDGPEDHTLARSYGGLEIRFGSGSTADALIVAEIRRRPGRWKVVTDDRDLTTQCRREGADVMAVSLFLDRIDAVSDRVVGEIEDDPVDIEEWEAWFRKVGQKGVD